MENTVLSFAPGTRVLWRDDRTECGIVVGDGRPVVEAQIGDGAFDTFLAGRLVAANPTAERARRALIENLPELYGADDVAAMSDDEAIAEAVNAAVMEG